MITNDSKGDQGIAGENPDNNGTILINREYRDMFTNNTDRDPDITRQIPDDNIGFSVKGRQCGLK
jgi:hypothetical protein